MGLASIVLPQFLDPVWGGLLIILGILALAIRKRGMFIVIGVGLILAGILNILVTALTFREEGTTGGWAVMGAFQIYWGIAEILKFRKYAPRPAEPPPLPGQA
ncbi:MAG: hypothetical protein JXB04_10920 [Kiritimatiellae bacterium]|nr:hypothetical protein [Kiritimatiellia bacterium]